MKKVVNEVVWAKEYELRSKLSSITNELTLPYQISLIFLLCQEAENGLDIINEIIGESKLTKRNNLFFKWLIQQKLFEDLNHWHEIFVEYLILVQHHDSVKILGYDKDKMINKFLPKNNFKTCSVSYIRKILYNLCKALTFVQSETLINLIEKKNEKQNEINNDEKVLSNYTFLEWKLLQWSVQNIIQLNEREKINLSALTSLLKSFGLCNLALDIDILVDNVNCRLIRKNTLTLLGSTQSEFYPILNENDLGFCVIINEKFFSNPALTTRYGTEKDVKRLTEVFTAFGFNVRVYSDLTYMKMIETLDHYARSIEENHSAFVLIILSHGSENAIYTTDSQAVDINTIEMIFQADICLNLLNKPKIFIVQSCQGEKWQKQLVKRENEEVDILMDSFMNSSANKDTALRGPQRGDSMIAWSTVRGFASFRDRHNGSWYIEELCSELWKFGDVFDLVEIFTRVNNNLRSRVHRNQFMVPSLLLSLRAKVKFPISKTNLTNGRLLMIKRLIFEQILIEFLENYSMCQNKVTNFISDT